MGKNDFTPDEQIGACFEQVLASSPADETELVWLERRRGTAGHRGAWRDSLERPRLTVLVRVVEGGRQGWYRTESGEANLLESGVRQALAMAKVGPRIKKRPILPAETSELDLPPGLFDKEIARLDTRAAHGRLRRLCVEGEHACLSWSVARLVIFNSHGLRRRADSSEASLFVAAGHRPGAGRAAGSARTLEALDAEDIRTRAHLYHTSGETAALPVGAVPILLAPEAAVELLNVINAFALAGRSYLDGTSFLSRYRNIQVFDRSFNLRDDGTCGGLPFPFDFEGSPKRRLELIVEGQPTTPALNRFQGAAAGMEPTAQAVGGQDSLFSNLFLVPGEAAEAELLAAADGGLRIGWLEPPECYQPSQLRVRAVARSVRRIEDGRLGAPLPDFVWEESLLRALARLRGIGCRPVVRSTPTTPLGGISTPAIVLAGTADFAPRPAAPESVPRPTPRPPRSGHQGEQRRRPARNRRSRGRPHQDRRNKTTV